MSWREHLWKLYHPNLLWRVPNSGKKLFLTFDDGPVPGPTEWALEELEKHQSKATFFCIGDNVRKHPEVFGKITEAGHALGNHTFHHVNGWKTKKEKYLEEVKRCDEVMGGTPFFRPPYGMITKAQAASLKERTIVMWDVLTHDFNRNFSPEKCLRLTLPNLREGSIVVFHDSIKSEKNLKHVLPKVLEFGKERGFSFESLREANKPFFGI